MSWQTQTSGVNADVSITLKAKPGTIKIKRILWSFNDAPTINTQLIVTTGTSLKELLKIFSKDDESANSIIFLPPLESDSGKELKIRISAAGEGKTSILNVEEE